MLSFKKLKVSVQFYECNKGIRELYQAIFYILTANELAAVMLLILSLTVTYEPNTAHWKWRATFFNV